MSLLTFEINLSANILRDSLSEATVQQFLGLNITQLKDFIHARKFNGRTFQESKIVGSAGNKIKNTIQVPNSRLD